MPPHPRICRPRLEHCRVGRPGPVVIALPEDMLTDVVEAVDRPRGPVRSGRRSAGGGGDDGPAQGRLRADRDRRRGRLVPGHRRTLRRVGGADRAARGRRVPRQDSIPNDSPVWAGNLGYGPNPKLVSG
jgi:acetolactate synthase-1/2/3 large subunit